MKKEDRDLVEYIRSAYALGDPQWRKMAIAHLQRMMSDPRRADRIAAALKVMSEKKRR